ncbi:hypothetical protein Taro_006644 [Colocasia esculenta]|uniref:Uncharacterized protein n=1 Tax=Colocasia esculenta TaxID=4460 RepID=A0A843TT02_COLES|nr:hypothetical protein [Colocasia esculenta]
MRALVPVCGGTGECGFPTWWCVQGLVWFCLWDLDLVKNLLALLLLAAVFSMMVRVVWSFGLCILVKVLPRIVLCRFWRRFFPGVLCVNFGPPLCCPCGLKCAVWLGCILVRFSQDGSWRFWWRFSLKLLHVVLMSCRCCRLDCLCYNLLGHFRSRCGALRCASGSCVGQVALLFVFKCVEGCFRSVPNSVGFCGSRFLLLWPVRDW